MKKKLFLVAIVVTVAVAAVAIIWLMLRPMTQPSGGILYSDEWKYSLTEGTWVSEDGTLTLDIVGTDFALKVNGVFASLGSFNFDDSGEVDEPGARFDMQIDPESSGYPDGDGAIIYEVTGLWHEGDAIFIIAAPVNATEGLPVCLSKVEAAVPTWASHGID